MPAVPWPWPARSAIRSGRCWPCWTSLSAAEAVGDLGDAVRLARQAVQVPGDIPASITRTCSMFWPSS